MTRYRYILTAITPVSAGDSDQRANVRHAHEVIPGATIRGALGAQWWRGKDDNDPQLKQQFEELFEQQLLVGQAVPDGYELLSASAKVCKYRPSAGCAGYVYDEAVPETPDTGDTCPHCGGPLAGARGWRPSPGRAATSVESRTRGALTRRETAEEGKLFTRQAIGAARNATVFTGYLIVPNQDEPQLATQLRVGGGKSIDFGNCTMQREATVWPQLPDAPEHVLRLVSPTITVDEYGGPDVNLTALEAELRRVSGDSQLRASAQPGWLRAVSVSGWHARSRLPKVLDWAFEPGGVVRVAGLTADGWQRLASGVGVRTLEGYGQLELLWSHPNVAEGAAGETGHAAAEPEQQDAASVPAQVATQASAPPAADLNAQAGDRIVVTPPAPPPASDAENEGIQKLKKLRARIKKAQDWRATKIQLLGALERLQDADDATAASIREGTAFPALLVADAAAAKAVLHIPASHIPGTCAKLEAMK